MKIKTLIFVAVGLCFLVNANSAFANFIDPSKPTREDEASESALAYAGQLVLAFFDHYFNKRQAIDSDALEFTIIRFTPEKYADDPDYDKMTKFYFRVILQEVSRNVRMAKNKEERREVYAKARNWLAARTGVDLSRYETPPTISEVNTILPGTDAAYSYYQPRLSK
jgi:hypothetical protein